MKWNVEHDLTQMWQWCYACKYIVKGTAADGLTGFRKRSGFIVAGQGSFLQCCIDDAALLSCCLLEPYWERVDCSLIATSAGSRKEKGRNEMWADRLVGAVLQLELALIFSHIVSTWRQDFFSWIFHQEAKESRCTLVRLIFETQINVMSTFSYEVAKQFCRKRCLKMDSSMFNGSSAESLLKFLFLPQPQSLRRVKNPCFM